MNEYHLTLHARDAASPLDELVLAETVPLEGVIGAIGSVVATHRHRIDWVDVVRGLKRLRFMVDHQPNAAGLPIIRAA